MFAMLRISIEELESSASLVLAQGNPLIMGGMRPVPPNVVYCGMMQCRQAGPLPEDLQHFMDSATQGVVLVSFGSVLQGSQVYLQLSPSGDWYMFRFPQRRRLLCCHPWEN